jgi:SAM-dependent methyltransferase
MAFANTLKTRLRKYLPAAVHSRMARTYRLIAGTNRAGDEVSTKIPNQVPNHLLEPPPELKFVGDGDFRAVGMEFLGLFTRFAELQPSHHVLDVGCGVGRMAVPLLDFLSTAGAYTGFDVVPAAVEWCRKNISPRNPRFCFELADIRSEYYYPQGRHTAEEYIFPYADQTFDFVFLTSVFTHMPPAAVSSYLRQIRRVLKPGGSCFSTWFVTNAESLQLVNEGRAAVQMRYPYKDAMTSNPAEPEVAIGIDEDRILALHRDAGLVLKAPIYFGTWCGRPEGITFQDVVVAVRPSDQNLLSRHST